MVEIGKKAPGFKGKDQDGNEISLQDFAGKKLVLYFYPKDNTPGCTAEACDLRDNYQTVTSDSLRYTRRRGSGYFGASPSIVEETKNSGRVS